MFCSSCGAADVSGRFCRECGKSLVPVSRVYKNKYTLSLNVIAYICFGLLAAAGLAKGYFGVINTDQEVNLSEKLSKLPSTNSSKSPESKRPQDIMLGKFEAVAKSKTYTIPANSSSLNAARDSVNKITKDLNNYKRQWDNECPVYFYGDFNSYSEDQAFLQQQYNEAISMNDLVRASEIKREMNNNEMDFNAALTCSAVDSKISKLERKLNVARSKYSSAQNSNQPTVVKLGSYKSKLWKIAIDLEDYSANKPSELMQLTRELKNYFGIAENRTLDILRETNEVN